MILKITDTLLALAVAAAFALCIYLLLKCREMKYELSSFKEGLKALEKRHCLALPSTASASARFCELTNSRAREEDGGVLINVTMPPGDKYHPSFQDIIDSGKILEDLGIGEVYHTSEYEFLLFTSDCYKTSDIILERLNECGDKNLRYAVGAELFYPSETDLEKYLRRLRKRTAVAEAVQCCIAVH